MFFNNPCYCNKNESHYICCHMRTVKHELISPQSFAFCMSTRPATLLLLTIVNITSYQTQWTTVINMLLWWMQLVVNSHIWLLHKNLFLHFFFNLLDLLYIIAICLYFLFTVKLSTFLNILYSKSKSNMHCLHFFLLFNLAPSQKQGI